MVDTGLLAGGAVASTAVGAGATSLAAGGMMGATAGSIAPGIGTAVGFGVGIVITGLLMTPAGRDARDGLVHVTKAGLDWAVAHPTDAARLVGGPVAVPGTLLFEHREEVADAAGRVVSAGAGQLERAGRGIGDAAEDVGRGLRRLGRLPWP